MPRNNIKITEADLTTQRQIIANACNYFQMTEYALVHYASDLIRNMVMYAIYKETNLVHERISREVLGRTNGQASFRATITIPQALRYKGAYAALIRGFYEQYGYCKGMMEQIKKAA